MLKIYNSLTHQKELFKPIHPPKVMMYVCGITVYDYCHLGHARTNVTFDIVVRVLRYLKFEVTYVRNITDIDDKIIQRAQDNQESCAVLTERFIHAMHEDEKALQIGRPDQEPRATAFVPSMIAMIQTLIAKNYAYVADSGDVCYDIRRFAAYGQLSNRNIDDLRAGERVDIEKTKRDPLDFVLWKMAKPGEPSWSSPWGEGRPGWHIECSAMATDCLANHIDIHGGGMDLLFPHHENEIAQSEATTGQQFVNTWMHLGFLNINAEKMSKSLKNFLTIRDVLKEHDAESLRYFYISAHYRKPLNYDVEQSIAQARAALGRFYTALRGQTLSTQMPLNTAYEERFKAALEDDFNTPDALAVLFDVVRELNKSKEENEVQAQELAALLKYLGGVLGILQQDPDLFLQASVVDAERVAALIEERNAARAQKNFKRADEIRAILQGMSVEIEDTAQGTIWRAR